MSLLLLILPLWMFGSMAVAAAAPLNYSVSWVGNSFPGASNRWVQNFLIHTQVQPDGTVNTWSHWDEGGKKFGVYKDGDVIGNTNVNPNSLETRDKLGRIWKLDVTYTDPKHQEWEFVPKGITCDGKTVTLPELFQPMALALAIDGALRDGLVPAAWPRLKVGWLHAQPPEVSQRSARPHAREATGRTWPHLAADCLAEWETVPVCWWYVREQFYQHLPLRWRCGDSFRTDPSVGQQPLQHRPQVAAEQAIRHQHLARHERRRRLSR